MPPINDSAEVFDVAIVGGGIAGIYSGWRLLTSHHAGSPAPPKVALFERSNRIGGRLLSVVPPGVPDARVELGGMRYTSAHTRVLSLIKHLGLMVDPFPVSEPQNIAFVRGKMLRQQDLGDADKIPYNLAPDERDPKALQAGLTAVAAVRALNAMGKNVSLADLQNVDWIEVAKNCRYQGFGMFELPMQFLIQRGISQEAFLFAQDTSGYDSIMHTWNAADGFPWLIGDFGKAVTYFHVREGYEVLPLKIAELFRQAGGVVQLETRLKSFDQVTVGGSPAIAMQFGQAGTTRTVVARRLILAMPRRSLELLDQTGAVLGSQPDNRRVRELIASVTPIPLFKLAVCYPSPWWENIDPARVRTNGTTELKKITQGQSITDMPVRQCYYWAVDQKTQNAVVLIYDDGWDLAYWAGLRDRTQGEMFASGDGGADDVMLPRWSDYKAPRLMVEEVHRQLKIMHGVQDNPDIPEPYAAAYRDWGEDPYGGGANFWHVGVDSGEAFRDILQPKPPVPVYICGEAYSNFQGWVEGPLETADQMLERHFGLLPPPWLPKS